MDSHAVLHLHIPEPKHRPGEHADFSDLRLPKAGSVKRPPITASAYDIRNLAYQLIRVLDDDGRALGPWTPAVDTATLQRGLRAMLLTRAYDERMYRMQRQGKTSFYMKCTGEEAVAVAQAGFEQLSRASMEDRTKAVNVVRQIYYWDLSPNVVPIFQQIGDGRIVVLFAGKRKPGC